MLEVTSETWIAIVAAIVSIVSALISFFSMRITRKGLRIEESRERRSSPNLTLDINDSYTWEVSGPPRRVCGFSLLLSNLSDLHNAVARIELLVDYELHSSHLVTAVFQPIEGKLDKMAPQLVAPFDLQPRSSVAGWVVFQLDAEVYKERRIRGYRVVVTDSLGEKTEARTIIMRELVQVPESDG